MKRQCLAYDVNPVRDDIVKHDATNLWTISYATASLVFLDPPYWKQKRGSYSGENNLADMSIDNFYIAMKTIFNHASQSLKSGGYLSVIVGPTQQSGIVYDHALEFTKILTELKLKYINRIIVPYSTQQVTGFTVAQARKSKYMLKLHRDLLIYQK